MIYINLLIDGSPEYYFSNNHHPKQYKSFLNLLSIVDKKKKLEYLDFETDFISVRIDDTQIFKYRGFDDCVVIILKNSFGGIKVETIYDNSGIAWENDFLNAIMNDI